MKWHCLYFEQQYYVLMFELLYFNFEKFEVETHREISTLYGVNVLYNKGLQNKSSIPFFAGDNIFIKNLISV